MSTIRSLENYTLGRWMPGEEAGTILLNAITAEPIALASSKGIDFEAVLNYGRQVGGSRLRKLTFQQRGRMLKALALHLMEKKDYFCMIRMFYFPEACILSDAVHPVSCLGKYPAVVRR